MPAWSSLWRGCGGPRLVGGRAPIVRSLFTSAARSGDHGPRTMHLIPSRFQWEVFKDMFHFYALLGIIPLSLGVLLTNVFVGPAQLEPIPEGYTPQYWEYHRHPITRFIARYCQHPPQQDYEKFMHFLYEEGERMKLRQLEKEVRAKMAERNDYQSFYYRPATAKYYRYYKEYYDKLGDDMGATKD